MAVQPSHDPSGRHAVVVHYHEIGLKGRNRGMFERVLVDNLERALSGTAAGVVEVLNGRLIVPVPGPAPAGVMDAIGRTFGVAVFASALEVDATLDDITQAALLVAARAGAETFAVAARRASKELAMTSRDINVGVGDAVRTSLGLRVDLDDPDLTVHVEVVGRRAWVYADRVRGPGGLPVGTSGKVMSLLSGGIDSPVATWKMLKRGAKAVLVHFHSAPFTDRSSVRKAHELASVIAGWQGPTRMHVVAFGTTQQQIVTATPPALRVVLYRRFMVRVAGALAHREKAKALVTGDSLGQVASQTLDNLRCVEDASPLPLLRPLIGDDKQDIVSIAQSIGTFETSILPYEDCCSLFVPKGPATHASIEECRHAEAELDVGALVAASVRDAELVVVGDPAARADGVPA